MIFRAHRPRGSRTNARLTGLAISLCVVLLAVPSGGAASEPGPGACLDQPDPSCLLKILKDSAEEKVQPWARADSFAGLGAAYARFGFTAEADRSFAEAIAVARRRELLLDRIFSLESIAEKLAEIGRTEQARLLMREVSAITSEALSSNRHSAEINGQLIYWLWGQARQQRSLGDTAGALESLDAAAEWTGPSTPPFRSWTGQLVGIAYEQAETGAPAAAERTLARAANLAQKIDDRPQRVKALFSVLNRLIRYGFLEPAQDTLELLRAELRTIDTDGGPPDPAYIRGSLAYYLLWIDDPRFSREAKVDKGLPPIPIEEPAADDLNTDACFDSPSVPCLIRTMANAARTVASTAERGGTLSRLGVVQAQAGRPDLAAEALDEAHAVFSEIGDPGFRLFHTASLVSKLAQAGFEERAQHLRDQIVRIRFAEIEKGEDTETNWFSGFMADARLQMDGGWPGDPLEALRNAAKAAAILQAQGEDMTAARGEIAELTARAGDRVEAGRMFDTLRSDLAARPDQETKFQALLALAAREVDVGFVDRARAALKMAHDAQWTLSATDRSPAITGNRIAALASGLLDTMAPK